jgi:hypothetical protein
VSDGPDWRQLDYAKLQAARAGERKKVLEEWIGWSESIELQFRKAFPSHLTIAHERLEALEAIADDMMRKVAELRARLLPESKATPLPETETTALAKTDTKG